MDFEIYVLSHHHAPEIHTVSGHKSEITLWRQPPDLDFIPNDHQAEFGYKPEKLHLRHVHLADNRTMYIYAPKDMTSEIAGILIDWLEARPKSRFREGFRPDRPIWAD